MSKTRMGKRVASLLLSLVMMLSLLPTTVYATEDTGGGTGATYSVDDTSALANTEETVSCEDGQHIWTSSTTTGISVCSKCQTTKAIPDIQAVVPAGGVPEGYTLWTPGYTVLYGNKCENDYTIDEAEKEFIVSRYKYNENGAYIYFTAKVTVDGVEYQTVLDSGDSYLADFNGNGNVRCFYYLEDGVIVRNLKDRSTTPSQAWVSVSTAYAGSVDLNDNDAAYFVEDVGFVTSLNDVTADRVIVYECNTRPQSLTLCGLTYGIGGWCDVVIDPNGGSFAGHTEAYTAVSGMSGRQTVSGEPVREGYGFAGWAISFTPVENVVTFTAQWADAGSGVITTGPVDEEGIIKVGVTGVPHDDDTEIRIDARADGSSALKTVIDVDQQTLRAEHRDVTIKTNVGTLVIDAAAWASMAAKAEDGSHADLSIERSDDGKKYIITAMDGSNNIYPAGSNGSVKISVPYEGINPVVYYVDGTTKTDMKATYENGVLTWVTNHFSEFVIEEASTAYVTVNGVGYDTLKEAIRAAKAGETVTLLADVNLDSAQTISKQLTLDLNGKTISSTAYRTIQLNAGADLTVKDSASGGKITNTYTGKAYPATIYLNAAGTKFTLEGGTIESDPNVTSLQSVAINSEKGKACEVNIKGGSVIVPEAATEGRGIVASTNSMTLKISGGTITGGLHGVDAYSGSTVNITGGEITAHYVDTGVIKEAYGMRLTGTANVTVAGGTITGVKMNDNGNDLPKVTLASGRVNGSFYSIVTSYKPQPEFTVAENATIVLGNDSAAKFLPDTVKLVQNSDGTYGVKAGAYVAQIGETTYETLEAAFAHAKDGDTITLLTDCSGNGIVVEKEKFTDKGLIVDFNNHTYTVGGVLVGSSGTKSNGFQLNKDNKITFRNGAIYGDASVAGDDTTNWTGAPAILIQNYCDLTLSGMKVSGGSNTVYTMSNNCGNVVIENTTINAGGGGSGRAPFALDACGYGSYTGVSVTVKGTSAINGDIEVSRSASNENAVKLALEGGTVTGELKIDSSIKSGDATTVTKGADVTLDAPTGYMWNDANTLVKAVAEVNGTQYETLQEAIDAASQRNGGQAVVTLLGNLTITETVNFANVTAASVLLDLGGYTLTGENCRALQINKGNLYLENGTVTSTGIDSSKSVIRIGSNEAEYSGISPMLYMRNGAKVLAPKTYGVTLFGSATVKEKLTVAGNASIVATGPSPAISGQGGQAYHVDGKGTEITITGTAVVSATNNYAIYHPDNGTLDIQGGTITGKGGIQMCSGTLNISGSPKIEALGKANHETGASGPIYDIAAISVVNRSYPGGAPVVTIKGTPTVTANEGEVIHAYTWSNNTESEWADAGKNINVSGGTYSKDFKEAYLAADCTLVDGENGTYTVEQKPVAEYNGTQYTSLPQALQDARNAGGGEVKLLKDVTQTTSSLDIGKVTLDLNRQTLTLDGGAQLYTSNAATIKNGTIKRTDEPTSGNANDFAIQVMSGSSLTLGATSADTVKIESTYGVYNVGGTLTVGHANITTDGWSIAVNDSTSKTGVVTIGEGAVITSETGNCISTRVGSKPNVTITGGQLTSNGTAWDAGVIYWASEGTLTITGGTFTASAEGSTAAAVHQKNGTVKISGTTAELQGNKALVVQAGDGSTGTMVTELSGGTYSTKPEEAWVVNGYRAIKNGDGSFTVKEAKCVIKVTSCIDGTDQTVATPTGGGMYCEGEKVTVATNAVAGFKFLGWYDGVTLLDTHMTYEHTVTGDCTLIAKYTAVSGGTFRLEVNASKFTVDEKTKMRYVDMRINAATEVVVEYTGNDKFLYWINGSNNVVSTEAKITLVAVGNFKLTAVVESTELGSDYAYVIFKNAFVKGQSLSADYYTSSDTIVFPSTPAYVGRTFKYWGTEVNGEIVEATQAVISGLIKGGAKTVIIAPVYESNGTYTVTVNYVDVEGNPLKDALTISGIGTGLMEYVTADEKIGELIFSHWEIGGKNVGTNKTYAALSRTDGDVVDLTAVYVTEGTVTTPENVLTIAATGATIVGGKYKLTFTANYSVDENATIKKGGFLFSNKDVAEEIFTIDNTSLVGLDWDGDIEQSGARNGVIPTSVETTRIYARAYITLADGTVIYSDIVNATYSEIVKK